MPTQQTIDRYLFWKDIDIWMRAKPSGDIADQENKYAILNSVYNILSTQPGDRRMLPTFACDMRGLLFEPMTAEVAQTIAQRILGALSTWEPRIRVTASNVIAHIDQMTYIAHITFEILKSNEQITLDFPIRKL